MDGTLLDDQGQVSRRNLAALQAAQAAGIEVVVATGRRHSYAMRVLRPLNLPHACTLVSSNGTVTRTMGCCHPGQELVASQLIARSHLSHEAALWLCGHLDEFRDALVLTFDRLGDDGDDTRGALVVEHLDELNASIGRWMAANEPYIERVNPIELALEDSDAPIQAMLCGTAERMRRAEARLLEHPGVVAVGHTPAALEPHHIIALHRTEYPARDLSILDILPAGCSKGAALLSLAAAQGIPADQILAIGDNWNDVSMLEVAGSAIVMGNAPEDLQALAGQRGWRIGPSNAQDGVAEAVEFALAVSAGH